MSKMGILRKGISGNMTLYAETIDNGLHLGILEKIKE